MATKKTTAVATVPSEEALAILKQEFPQDQGFVRSLLPRISMTSQDVTEEVKKNGKKQINVITEAGTFFLENQSEEKDEEGKNVWDKDEIGDTLEGIVIYHRKQLKYYDESTETFTSSPIYDDEADVIPLFLNKKEIARGTPAELKARPEYQFVKDGKTKSKLEDNRILYILYKGENDEEPKVYQLNLRGTSMFSWMTYARKTLVPAFVTKFSSEAMEKGSLSWNKMVFEAGRPLNQKEVEDVIARVQDIKAGIAQEKKYFAAVNDAENAVTKEFNNF